jgi:NAD(P)-dependent dehydrogenase (short-subunit alcohol dehydrogenase family)
MTSVRTVVITGANSGIGFEAALHFARAGARVVMACRNLEKAEEAQRKIRAEVRDDKTVLLPLDVAELGSVRNFARHFAAHIGELDVLINNAGMIASPLVRTSDGNELLLATNFLGAFALTGLLLSHFADGRRGRIVHVGSLAHRFAKPNLDDLNWHHTPHDAWKAYSSSKLALLSHALELNRRLCKRAPSLFALAAHPGFANTEINRQREANIRQTRLRRWYVGQMMKIVPTPAQAARSIIVAATSHEVGGGEYIGPTGLFEIRGKPGRARMHPAANSEDFATKLWSEAERLTNVRYLSSSDERCVGARADDPSTERPDKRA